MVVRLTEQQIQGIVLAVKEHVKDIPVALYLYGSRVKLDAKGGDIDLLLLFDSANDKKALLSTKHALIADIKNYIGDQKVDVFFACKEDLKADAFLKVIFRNATLLYP